METPKPRSLKEALKLIFCGSLMGTADLVPGISGGTVAFITGIYGDLLHSISTVNGRSLRALLCGRWKDLERLFAWRYLLCVGAGIALALFGLAQLIHDWLGAADSRCLLYSAFLGFILASVFLCLRHLVEREFKHAVGLLCGASVAFLGTQDFTSAQEKTSGYTVPLSIDTGGRDVLHYDAQRKVLNAVDAHTVSTLLTRGILTEDSVVLTPSGDPVLAGSLHLSTTHRWLQPWIIFCGALAICAMLLPGVSGSYLLHILGLYTTVISALADLSAGVTRGAFDPYALAIVSNLALGAVAGGLLFARVISWLLDHYHELTLSVLLGFMVGALPILWPFWSYSYKAQPLRLHKGLLLHPDHAILPDSSEPLTWIAISVAIAGFSLVILSEKVASRLSSK